MIDLIPPDHEDRRSVERFVHERFLRRYQADIRHFMPYLLRIRRDGSGDWIAVAGARPAGDGAPLFLEQYLDVPIERAISERIGASVDRSEIVEIGNLAESENGGARHAITALTGLLYGAGFVWVAFTAVRLLLNAFSRLELQPTVLAMADPARLSTAQRLEWGSYYDNSPQVVCGRIDHGFQALDSLRNRLAPGMRASLLVGYHIGRWWRERRPA